MVTAKNRIQAWVAPALLSSTVIASCLEDSSKPATEPRDAGTAGTTSDAPGTAGSSSGGATSSDSAAEDAGSGGAGGSAIDCPPKATSCPPGCNKVDGLPIDFEKKCFYGGYQPLGCYLGTGGELAMYGCIRDPNTTISYEVPSVSAEQPLFATGEWVPCPGGWMTFQGKCP